MHRQISLQIKQLRESNLMDSEAKSVSSWG